MIARPWRGEIGDDRVDLGLGLHVDALGRLVQDQHARLGRQPLRQHDLLLVAAGQGLDRLQVAPEAQPQAVEMAAHQAQLACRAGSGRPSSPGRSPAATRWRGSRSPSPGSGRSGPPRRRRCPAAMASLGEANATSRPSSWMVPAVGWSTPNSTRAISVRPLPTRPAKPRISPARTSKRDVGKGAVARKARAPPAPRRRAWPRVPGTCRSARGRPSGGRRGRAASRRSAPWRPAARRAAR